MYVCYLADRQSSLKLIIIGTVQENHAMSTNIPVSVNSEVSNEVEVTQDVII